MLSATLTRLSAPTVAPLSSHRRAPARKPPAAARALFGGGNKEAGGGNPLANIGGLMENMRKAQEEAGKVQRELAAAQFEGYSACETVRAVMTGAQEPVSVDITEEAYAQGAEALGGLVTEALKDAHAKSVEGMKARMREMASSLGLPGMPGGM